MWETILGGVLAIIGGWAAIWYQLSNTRKIRMDEVTAERKVTVNAEAYMYMKQIQSSYIQQDPKTTLDILASNEAWFFGNRLFLPGRFPEKWLLIRKDLSKSIRWRTDSTKTTEEKIELEERGLQNEPLGVDIAEPAVLFALQAAGLNVVDGQQLMLNTRKTKTQDEIMLLNTACSMVDAV